MMKIETKAEYVKAIEKLRELTARGPYFPHSKEGKECSELVNAIVGYEKGENSKTNTTTPKGQRRKP